MENFFEKENSANWSFDSYLAKTGAKIDEDFNTDKTNYISEMRKLSNLEDFVDLRQRIGRYIKEAKDSKFKTPTDFPPNIHIEGDVVQSIVGSSSSTLKITNNRKRQRASHVTEEQQSKEEQEEKHKQVKASIILQMMLIFSIMSTLSKISGTFGANSLKECKADQTMHEFSLEKVGITQYGYKVKMRTCLVRELYEHMMIQKPILYNAFDGFEEDTVKIFLSENESDFLSNLKQFKHKYHQNQKALFLAKIMKLLMEIPVNAQKQQWMHQSEANYSGYMIWELFKIVTDYSNNKDLCFEVGEYKVHAVKNEIIRREDKELKSYSYNADGCHTALVGGRTIELSILEVTGHFGLSDVARTTQDPVKGGFGILALLQEIAHVFEFGSLNTFYKIRTYFVHALEEKLRLWSLEQVSRGVCVMELIESADIPTNFEDNEMCIRDVTNLFCTYKNGLEKSLIHIKQLEREHKQVKLSVSRKIVNPASTISLVDSLEKGCILKIKGGYIPGYPELQVSTS